MVSLRLSHCHSASETFIGRLCWRTRSRTVRRTSSSLTRRSVAVLRSSLVAMRTMDFRGSGLGKSRVPSPQSRTPTRATPLALFRGDLTQRGYHAEVLPTLDLDDDGNVEAERGGVCGRPGEIFSP